MSLPPRASSIEHRTACLWLSSILHPRVRRTRGSASLPGVAPDCGLLQL